MIKILVLILLLVVSGSPLIAQDDVRMDQIVMDAVTRDEFSGSVLVARNGNIILDKGYGLANREWAIPNDGDTKYRLASVTKQFTAVAVMILHERGLVSLDEPIKTYLTGAPAAWDNITVKNLLTHSSGIPNFTDFDDFEMRKKQFTTVSQLIDRFRDRELAFEPGNKWEYSNSNYTILTAIIEQVGGVPYSEFVSQNLFAKLGMFDSGYDTYAAVIPKRASGYVLTAKGIRNADYIDMSIPQGAGGLYSTTRDLLKWNQGLYAGQLLTPESMQMLTKPFLNGYAFGLMTKTENGHKVLSHSGGIEGFNTYLGYDETNKVSIAVLGNVNGPAPGKLGELLMLAGRGEAVKLTSERIPITLNAQVLKSYEGLYEITENFVLTLSVVDGTLRAQATNQDSFELFAEAKDKFFLSVVDAQISVVRDKSGAITGLILHQGGRDMYAVKKIL